MKRYSILWRISMSGLSVGNMYDIMLVVYNIFEGDLIKWINYYYYSLFTY